MADQNDTTRTLSETELRAEDEREVAEQFPDLSELERRIIIGIRQSLCARWNEERKLAEAVAAEIRGDKNAHDHAINTALGAIHSIHAIARALLDETEADSDALLATILRESERARESLDTRVIWGFGR